MPAPHWLGPLPAWKRDADFVFVQVSFGLDEVLAWRDRVRFDGDVYVGVMVLPSASMARKVAAAIPDIAVPPAWIDAVERDRNAGVEENTIENFFDRQVAFPLRVRLLLHHNQLAAGASLKIHPGVNIGGIFDGGETV